MLDQLVESKSNRKENKTRGGYLLTTFMVVAGLLSSAVVYSLFAKDFGIGNNDFELSKLIMPLPVVEDAPPKKEPKPEQSKSAKSEAIIRQTNMLRVDEIQSVPDKISVVPNAQKARPAGRFSLKPDGTENEIPNFSAGGGRSQNAESVGISNNQSAQIETAAKTNPPLPPPIKKPVAEPSEKKKTIVSRGVVNGQAISLPKPPYPPAARAVNAGGLVNVQVVIDENGKIISAKAVDGHYLLRQAAEKAALSAKFKPTLLSDQPVKVTGVIVYKFAAQ